MKNRLYFILPLLVTFSQALHADRIPASFGFSQRPTAKPYLEMPEHASGILPQRLSQTGAFRDTARLIPADCLIPYLLNFGFYSDGAMKSRWVSIPANADSAESQVHFSATGEWKFPKGTVFVKHFELVLDEQHPELRRRLETRLLVCDADGTVYGATYKWRPDNQDADLVTTSLSECLTIQQSLGERQQGWYYPSRADCRTCHTDLAGGVLGANTRQLNGDFTYPSGIRDNQLRSWSHAGLFDVSLKDSELKTFPALVRPDAQDESIENRARSYLDANCSHCHRPGGTVANFDARFETPLKNQNLINGPVLIDQGIDRARVIAPNDIWRSIAYLRVGNLDSVKMPPLAHERLDNLGMELLREWIESLPGPTVLPPPTFQTVPAADGADAEIQIRHPEPGVELHYTLDGSSPSPSDPLYTQPISVLPPVVVRARAYKSGWTRSIAAQQFVQSSQ